MGHTPITNTNPHMCGLWAHGGRVHPDRVIVPTPKPHDAPPGVMPFHRYLQSLNQNLNQHETQCPVEPANHPEPLQRSPDTAELGGRVQLLPKLGDLPAPTPAIESALRIEQVRQQHVPATGRVLDLYI